MMSETGAVWGVGTNLMASLNWSNQAAGGGAFDSNGMAAAGSAAAAPGSNALASAVSGLSSATAMDQGATRLGTAPGVDWSVSVGGYTIDCNPFDMSWVVDLAAWVRAVVTWVVIGGIVWRNSRRMLEAINALGAARQASSAATAPGISVLVALTMAVVITVAMLAVPTFCVSWFAPYLGVLSSSPFITSGSAASTGLWMADQFFPISLMAAAWVVDVVFVWSLGAVVWGVQTVTRFLTG